MILIDQNKQMIEIDDAHAEQVVCKHCGNDMFIPVVKLRRISKFVSPTGKGEYGMDHTFACSTCNEELIRSDEESDEPTETDENLVEE